MKVYLVMVDGGPACCCLECNTAHRFVASLSQQLKTAHVDVVEVEVCGHGVDPHYWAHKFGGGV